MSDFTYGPRSEPVRTKLNIIYQISNLDLKMRPGLILAILIAVAIVIVIVLAILWYLADKAKKVKNKLINNRQYLRDIYPDQGVAGNIDIPLFYINLARSPERRQFMTEQFEFYQIKNYTRIEGVDGKNDPSIKYKNGFTGLSAGQIGCTLSHLRAIKSAYEQGLEAVLIIEDDTSLDYAPHWDRRLSTWLAEAPPGWKVLQLYSSYDYTRLRKKTKYHRPRDDAWATVAYVINRAGMESLLAKTWKNGTFLLSPRVAARGMADYYIYYGSGAQDRYITNPPLFSHFDVHLPSTIFKTPFEVQLYKIARVMDYYMDRVYHKYGSGESELETFRHLARARTLLDRGTSPRSLDIVLAYYKADLNWFFQMLTTLEPGSYRLFVYSKGGQEIPSQYAHLIDSWVELRNIGRCDHTYVYHLLNVGRRSDKTFLIKDSANRHMSDSSTWLKDNLNRRGAGVRGPLQKRALSAGSLCNFQLGSWEKSHDQNQGDAYIRAPVGMKNFRDWCQYLSGDVDLCSRIGKVIYGGIILFPERELDRSILVRAGLSLSYGSNIETGHFMERFWYYLLRKSSSPSLDPKKASPRD